MKLTPSVQRIQKPRNSPALKMPLVGVSALSGLVRFFRMTDFVFSQPPMNTSTIGSLSAGPVVKAIWASFGERTLKLKMPLRTGFQLYSNLSGVSSADEFSKTIFRLYTKTFVESSAELFFCGKGSNRKPSSIDYYIMMSSNAIIEIYSKIK